MHNVRKDEPPYALLKAVKADQINIYGTSIDLIEKSGQPKGLSLKINDDESVGTTPNRYKQHGFHFTADNCIGCHACEAACSEKNDLPPYLSFRSVGYVEGGTYPSFTRMNISMACNHCDDPVCLKGCPTRAYTKHPEFGAVLQDPEICFGCGYCTWVCPYNAPQLDQVKGHVQKCNMCVDRIEVGLKPACVSACLGNALDFGVIETKPENRDQTKTTIPGFPDPTISKPNIRFQQTKSMPREFKRTDSMPIKYHRNDETGDYRPTVDKNNINKQQRRWNLAKLSSQENPLVIFTLTTQAVIGAFLISFIGLKFGQTSITELTASNIFVPFLFILTGLQAFALFLSTHHLGKPLRFYRGFNNLRHSPLSREALGISMFFGFLASVAVLSLLDHGFLTWFTKGTLLDYSNSIIPGFGEKKITLITSLLSYCAVFSGLLGLYSMHSIYRIKARPFWNHWQTLTSFFGSTFSLGAVLTGIICIPLAFLIYGQKLYNLTTGLVGILIFGLAIEAIGYFCHVRHLQGNDGEGFASYHRLTTKFGYTYFTRNLLMGFCLTLAIALSLKEIPETWEQLSVWGILVLGVSITALISRALFYVVVIPTTMPGAFFWKNKGFEEHARKTRLAKLPQVGVLDKAHN